MTTPATNRLTLATKITLTRVLMIPVFVVSLAYERPGVALSLLILAGVADGVDGYLARRRGEMTALGAMLDPIADKLLMFSAYVLMGINGYIPAWLAIVVVSRDVLLCLGFLLMSMTADLLTPAPSMLGKATTVLQMTTAGAALLTAAIGPGIPEVVIALYIVTGALTIASGLHYLFSVGARMVPQRGAAAPAKGNPPPPEAE